MVFADAFNQFLYHGGQKIDPARLTELDTTGIVVPYGADGAGVPEQKYRDVLKLLYAMTDGKAAWTGMHPFLWKKGKGRAAVQSAFIIIKILQRVFTTLHNNLV